MFPLVFKDKAVMAASLREMEEVGIEFRNLMGGLVTQHPVYSCVPSEKLDNCNATSQNVRLLSLSSSPAFSFFVLFLFVLSSSSLLPCRQGHSQACE